MSVPSVSIVVPVYGVARYIERCARSLFGQTMDNLEFIFVDDCTPDKSIEILKSVLEEYPKRIPQTKILSHKVNQGSYVARQTGLDAAMGEFVLFCDSDDFVEKDICEKFYTKAIETGSDMVVCDFVNEYSDRQVYESGTGPADKIALINSMLYKNTPWVVWNRLTKRSLFENGLLESDKGMNMAEDLLMSIQLVYFSKRVSYVEEALYHYSVNTDSMSHDISEKKSYSLFCQAKSNTDKLIEFLTGKGLDYKVRKSLDYTKLCQRQILLPLVGDSFYYSVWRSAYPELNYRVWRMQYPFKEKCKFYLALSRIYKPSPDKS